MKPELPSPELPIINTQGIFSDYPPPSRQGHFLLENLTILRERKWTVIATAVIIFSLAALSTFRTTPTYSATGLLAINRENSAAMTLKDENYVSSSDDWDYNVVLETQLRILESDPVALQTIKDLKLDTNPAFSGGSITQKSPDLPVENVIDSAQQSRLISRLKSGLKVTVIPRTRILRIQYSDPDPKLAAEIVNGMEKAFIEQNISTRFDSVSQTSEWLSNQLADMQLKVETSQERLVRYQKDHGILGIDEKQNIVTSKLDEMNKNLTAAEMDRIDREAIYKLSQTRDPELLARVDTNSSLDQLRNHENDLKSQYAKLTTEFGPAYPKVQEVSNQLKQVHASIQNEIKRIADRAESQYLAAVQRENMLRTAMETQKREANQLNESSVEYNLLKRDADANRQLYEDLLQKVKEAGITAGLRSSNIRIVETARVPSTPSSPNIPRNLMIGLFLGLAAGIGAAFIQEALDNTVKSPEQAQAITFLPTLALIPSTSSQKRLAKPLARRLRSRNNSSLPECPITVRSPRSEVAECFRALRTSILLSTPGGAPQCILVTSALPQEGKTTSAVNTAIVLAQGGKKVLLIDADLRRSMVHRSFGLPNDIGLSNLLSGGAELRDACQSTGVPNLSVITSGPSSPGPSELICSTVMMEHIARWRKDFDHIVFDSPPVLSVTDAVFLSAQADAVLLVVRVAQTAKAALRRTFEMISIVNARVLGIVVNGLDLHKNSYYSYYYGYGKKYGSYYDDADKESDNAGKTSRSPVSS